MFTTKNPTTLEDVGTALRAQTEVLQRVLTMQAMQGEMLSNILAAVTRQPEQEAADLEAVLRALFAVNTEHAAKLAEVVMLLKARLT
jgi:hypothetical protein